MDGTRGRLYRSGCHATSSQSHLLGCKMKRGSPGRGDSQDITVKGFAVTCCHQLNYISPRTLNQPAFCSRLNGAGFSLALFLSLCMSSQVSRSLSVSLACSLCFSLSLLAHTHTHTFCHNLLLPHTHTHTRKPVLFLLLSVHQEATVRPQALRHQQAHTYQSCSHKHTVLTYRQ